MIGFMIVCLVVLCVVFWIIRRNSVETYRKQMEAIDKEREVLEKEYQKRKKRHFQTKPNTKGETK